MLEMAHNLITTELPSGMAGQGDINDSYVLSFTGRVIDRYSGEETPANIKVYTQKGLFIGILSDQYTSYPESKVTKLVEEIGEDHFINALNQICKELTDKLEKRILKLVGEKDQVTKIVQRINLL